MLAAEDVEGVPAGKRGPQRVLAPRSVTEQDDLGDDIDLPVLGEVFELLDERVREDDLRLIVGKATGAAHYLSRSASARARTLAGSRPNLAQASANATVFARPSPVSA